MVSIAINCKRCSDCSDFGDMTDMTDMTDLTTVRLNEVLAWQVLGWIRFAGADGA